MRFFLIFLAILFLACNSNKPITLAKFPTGTTCIGILNKSQKPDYISNDFQIKNFSINADTLFLDVVYSGGCTQHEFHAYKKDYYKESITIDIIHNNNSDACRALIEEQIWFDLSNLKKNNKTQLIISIHNTEITLEYNY